MGVRKPHSLTRQPVDIMCGVLGLWIIAARIAIAHIISQNHYDIRQAILRGSYESNEQKSNGKQTVHMRLNHYAAGGARWNPIVQLIVRQQRFCSFANIGAFLVVHFVQQR